MIVSRASLDGLDCVPGDGKAGGRGLQAADTGTAAARAISVEDDVSHLGAQALAAQQQSAIHDDAAANASAVGDVDQIPRPLASPEALIRQCSQVGVISQVGGQPQFLLNDGLEGHLIPAGEIGGFDDHAFPRIQGAARAIPMA
jgi:hypothetical protein